MKQLSIIILLLSPIFSNAQWSGNPSANTAITTAINSQQDVRIVSDGNGGAILAWVDLRTDSLTGDIYAQKINANGMVQWTSNGIGVAVVAGNDQVGMRMIEDGKGGAILTWKDLRNSNSDIYAQRINANGNPLWTANGVVVVQKVFHQENAIIASNGNSGAIIAWQDSSGTSWDIYAQQIDSSGTQLWNNNGVAICSATGDQVNPKIVSDVNGSAVIVWQDKRNLLDYNIYAQRVNNSGAVQWATDGLAICSQTGTQNNPKIVGDGAGNFLIVWPDKRNTLDYNVYAQAINTSGAVQWAADGVAICAASANQSAIDLAADASGIFIAWKDSRSVTYSNIYGQRINWSGLVQWATDGIAIIANNANQLNPNLVLDGSGGVFIVWQDNRNGLTNNDVYGQRINSSGTLLWNATGVAVGTAANNQLIPKQINDGNGNMIVAWQDYRNGTDFNIYAQKVFADGSLLLPTEMVEINSPDVTVSVFPNPAKENVEFRIENLELKNQKLELSIYDVLGQEVKNIQQLTSHFQLRFDNIQSGIYFYKILNDKKEIANGKIVIE